MPDGTPVEIVLNPLGVPSRMNVGQILETHLGWAGKELGNSLKRLLSKEVRAEAVRRCSRKSSPKLRFTSPSPSSTTMSCSKSPKASATESRSPRPCRRRARTGNPSLARSCGLAACWKDQSFRRMSGDMFDQPVTVGYIYMLKLSHLVDDKIHARSIGPYSLITQQPLGGKAQFGGQRFGEMEVWALEAYGARTSCRNCSRQSPTTFMAAENLRGHRQGRAGHRAGRAGIVNVLVRELQSLCLDVELMKRQNQRKKPPIKRSECRARYIVPSAWRDCSFEGFCSPGLSPQCLANASTRSLKSSQPVCC